MSGTDERYDEVFHSFEEDLRSVLPDDYRVNLRNYEEEKAAFAVQVEGEDWGVFLDFKLTGEEGFDEFVDYLIQGIDYRLGDLWKMDKVNLGFVEDDCDFELTGEEGFYEFVNYLDQEMDYRLGDLWEMDKGNLSFVEEGLILDYEPGENLELVEVETKDGDTVIYNRDAPSSAWIQSDETVPVER
ncbi:MAG: hypothetical protein ABEJ93_05210 [Candidatus Nanohalobium sp.]